MNLLLSEGSLKAIIKAELEMQCDAQGSAFVLSGRVETKAAPNSGNPNVFLS